MNLRHIIAAVILCGLSTGWAAADPDDVIPHNQNAAPGPALSPEDAVERMTVPDGFSVEVVASEPDIVNPVAMTFDERGRVWVTESLEYPRRSAGPGRDRVKILEDTDGDGKMDRFTVFADGLNIPSGIAVGWGGVWVANAPDILFMQDTDGDDRADTSEVVVTGFGRDDTHELPNSLTWGPDGWLYGLNGVFNASTIRQGNKEFRFTCALFRIHPKTHEFQLFAEGTSNPWGIAWDGEGSAFVSACVIDHLWHLAERGYYHRQGGPYPPYTWKLGSIVRHTHQKAAYCGIHFFDSDAYPPQYRERLYMGNIHGNCINCDVLERDGATYFARPAPDFLAANDAWFMPVAQKTGPDGCLYILDWYDRYHCYQDANRDPAGIDRLKGRLYRVRYQETPRAPPFDLRRESDEQLVGRLASANVFYRDLAQRLLAERNHPSTRMRLQSLVLDEAAPRRARMHALWALLGSGPLAPDFHLDLLRHPDALLRAWGVRGAGNMGQVEASVRKLVIDAVHDGDPRVRLQAAVAIPKIIPDQDQVVALLAQIAATSGEDKILAPIVWRNLEPLLGDHAAALVTRLEEPAARRSAGFRGMMPYIVDRILDSGAGQFPAVAALFRMLAGDGKIDAANHCLTTLTDRIVHGELSAADLERLRASMRRPLHEAIATHQGDSPLSDEAVLLAAAWGDPQGLAKARNLLVDSRDSRARLRAGQVMAFAGDPSLVDLAVRLAADVSSGPRDFRAGLLALLARRDDPGVPAAVLRVFPALEPELQAQAADLLTARVAWAHALLDAMESGSIPTSALHETQVRKLLSGGDASLVARLEKVWGTLRTSRDPKREEVLARMKVLLRNEEGDPRRGEEVFARLCGQCHKIHGQGTDVGPDITANGRGSFDQLLSNIFDPSLVIGAAYQARTAVVSDGRVITGLLAEDGPQRVVLKTQGGKLEVIPRNQLEQLVVSQLSLMPEGIEDQYSRREIADMISFLMLDRPPSNPNARSMPGLFEVEPRRARSDEEAARIVAEVAPAFRAEDVGEGGVELLAEHRGRKVVVRTHPRSQRVPCVLRGQWQVPVEKTARLALAVSHHEDGDWRLVVRINGDTVRDLVVGESASRHGWLKLDEDLTPWAGQTVAIELENVANDWHNEFGYWGRVEFVVE